MGNRNSTGSDEVIGLRKPLVSNVANEVISEIGAVCEIENLKDRLQICTFLDLESLGNARIQLEEWLAPQIVERCECALA